MTRSSLLLAAFCAAWCAGSSAAGYPERPLRLIVPSGAGGGPDVGARLIGAQLTRQLGQQIVIENRAGGSGTIGTEAISRATPDGYTVGQGNFTSLGTNRILLAKLPYDPDRDIQPLILAYTTRNLLAVGRELPIASVPDLIAYAKKNPGALLYGSSAVGSSMHFSAAMFCLMTGVDMRHVPYKTAQAAITDIIAGQIQLMFDNISSIGPHVKAGRVRGLAVTSLNRTAAYPNLPSVAETLPGFEVTPWSGFILPAGVPKAIVARLNAEFNRAIEFPAVRDRLVEIGSEPRGGTPAEFGAFIRAETAKWSDVAKRANVRLE